MDPNTKRRLAVNTMIDLALREQEGPVGLVAIADRQQVSLSCIEQLFTQLRRAGLVESIRGPGGGYSLAREATEISVAEIVGAVEAGMPGEDLDDGRAVLANDLSQRLGAVMDAYMAGVALSDLMAGQREARVGVEVLRPRRSAIAPRPQPSPAA